jgi:hypothetical protein
MIMKKLVTALALCASFSAFAAVESQNIVGYKGDIMLAGENFSMLSSPFVPVGGGSAMPIATLFTDNSIFTASDTAETADWIAIWENGAYRGANYFYSSDAGNAWSVDGFDPTTDTIPVGTAFWLYRQNASSGQATISGQVLTTNVSIAVVGQNFTMVANPYAAALNISQITGADLAASDTAETADWIAIWENGAYRGANYFYSSDAGNAWSVDGFDPTTDTVPAGGGFWFYRQNAGGSTITLDCPY